MEYERLSMARLEEIQRLIKEGLSNRQISRTLRCRRSMVSAVRGQHLGAQELEGAKTAQPFPPSWTLLVDWTGVETDLKKGFEIKRIWEEWAQGKTSHSNFYKHLRCRFPLLFLETVTLREFKPGQYLEVDYAGGGIEWIDRGGEIHEARVFVGILCFSQLLFAYASENEKKENWLMAHRRMMEFYGGSPHVLVCDHLRNAVNKSHLYDPDLNPEYVHLARHYGTAVVPARVRHPKDKALVEGGVKLIMRLFRWMYRHHTFTSLAEIQAALRVVIERINTRKHTRFGISRRERYETLEKATLKALPEEAYELEQWKTAVLHPDSTVAVLGSFYSAPHIHRSKELRIRITENNVEVFFDLKRIALHPRVKGRTGQRVIDPEHLPPNSKAYLEATPQKMLALARFIEPEFHHLIEEIFAQDTLGNLRRAQGLVRRAQQVYHKYGPVLSQVWIREASLQMRRFGRNRVQMFEGFIKQAMKNSLPKDCRTIVRTPGNPMLRNSGDGSIGVQQELQFKLH